MTLSQRLTRAGLTFILLGSVAAALPENGQASADTVSCSGGSTTQYRLTDHFDGTDNSAATIKPSSDYGLYTFISTDSGQTFKSAPSIPVADSGGHVSLGGSTTDLNGEVVASNTDGQTTGTDTITATFTDQGGNTRVAQFKLTVSL